MTVMIDSDSTHSFVDPHIVKLLKLPVQPMSNVMRVIVVNGQVMSCHVESPLFYWTMQKEHFDFILRLLKVGGCAMI